MPATPSTTALPSGLWRAHELARGDGAVLGTGFAALDAQLPGGGWPLGAMVELLQDQALRHEWTLLAPALRERLHARAGPLVLVQASEGKGAGADALAQPFAPVLAAQGLPLARLLWVRADGLGAQLWAAEQALRCAQVAGVLLWLGFDAPRAADRSAGVRLGTGLRRLQLAAQARGQLLFVLRPAGAAREASPAPLRVQLSGADAMQLRILKRRGPPLDERQQAQLHWPAGSARLQALLGAARGGAAQPAGRVRAPLVQERVTPVQGAVTPVQVQEVSHALDRA